MLSSVKQSILDLPQEDFGEFYRRYVIDSQDTIINHDLSLADRVFKSISNVTEIIQGLNIISEELKRI